MIAPARVAAYAALSSMSAGRVDLPTAVTSARAALEDDRDCALAFEIVTGVQRWRAALDHVIVAFARRPLERLDREVIDILRLSAYQLLHLTRVPASAIVDDAVHLTGRAGKRSAAGLVNAVLRAVSRRRHSLPLPPRPIEPADRDGALQYFSVTLSHPRWLVARWYDRYGFDAAEQWLQFNNTPAPLTLRANRLRATPAEVAAHLAQDDVMVTPGRFAPDALVVTRGHPLAGTGLDRGLFVVQDEASQLVPLLAGSAPGDRVLDTCASPGGKTTALAAAMGNAGLLVASDLRPRRMEILRRIVAACGASNVRLVEADALAPLPFLRPFNCVLVDAPCSGVGTLRRDPDIRWRRREDDLPRFAAAQREMLRNAASVVAPGGRLVYATCSSEPDENEAVVDAFAAGSADFELLDLKHGGTALPAAVIDERGHLRTSPSQHGLEAFFGAVLLRRT
jgi:16S rRNA (cytosine967-C5)-methyltransferase